GWSFPEVLSKRPASIQKIHERKENMAQTKIKPVISCHGMSYPDLLKQLNVVHDRMNGNPAFPNPTLDLATFKSGIDRFTVLLSNAADGGRKVISEKNKQRQALTKMYGQLGRYVEDASNDD